MKPLKEVTPSRIPEGLNTAIENGKIQAPAHIFSGASDDRGTAGMLV